MSESHRLGVNVEAGKRPLAPGNCNTDGRQMATGKWLAYISKNVAPAALALAIVSAFLIISPTHSLHASTSTAQEQPATEATSQTATGGSPEAAAPPADAQQKITAYTLTPEQYKKAVALSRTNFIFALVDFFYGLFILWLVLHWKLAPKFRDWAERLSSNGFVQAFIFTTPLILALALLDSPSAVYEHTITLSYGLSVEGWGALAWDFAKGIMILILVGGFLAWILYSVIRRSPRRWWFYFWLAAIPMIVFVSFAEPFVLEPMFFKFAPLQDKDPALVTQIERVVQRSGLVIPPDRIFWMNASDKTPLDNAYVTGIGASKRIVVWDTTIKNETTPEIVSVVGHEMGHYVLGHIWKGLIVSIATLFILLYAGYQSVGWVLERWGDGWGIRGLGDWASLPVLLLLLSIFSFISDPISNAYSRHIEHQADLYGLEVTHGILPDAGQAAADSFQVEGLQSFDDPNPNPVDVFLFFDHPPISDRVQFCLTYNPWTEGRQPQFVK
jgi:STE24 endopeptidase